MLRVDRFLIGTLKALLAGDNIMTHRKRPESEYVAIGMAWIAAALLCVFVFPELQDLRSLMGPLVLNLYGAAALMLLALGVCRLMARPKPREDTHKVTHPY